MELIYSKVEPDKLLHVIRRFSSIESQRGKRVDVLPADNFLQCSTLKLESGVTFRPHKHIYKERSYNDQIAQESWVVIKGRVECTLYDLDDTILAATILTQGDASFTLHGGHNYLVLDDAIVYEYKTGPYEGQSNDKKFID